MLTLVCRQIYYENLYFVLFAKLQGWKKPGFFQKNQKTWFFWFKPGFFGLNQVFFQSHICVFMNENSHVLEQLITNINNYLI